MLEGIAGQCSTARRSRISAVLAGTGLADSIQQGYGALRVAEGCLPRGTPGDNRGVLSRACPVKP